MNILVGAKGRYSGWVTFNTMKDALAAVGDVRYLVFHKSPESTYDFSTRMTEFAKKHPECKIIYLANKGEVNATTKVLINGLGGQTVEEAKFYLESATQLKNLTDDVTDIVALTDLSGIDVLKGFFERYGKTNGDGITKPYLQVVKKAVSDLASAYNDKNKELLEMSESATDLFQQSLTLVSEMQQEQTKLADIIADLKARIQADPAEADVSIPTSFQMNTFPAITYGKSKEIVRIKDIGRCSFLTSFMLGYHTYLRSSKNVRSRIIFVEPIGSLYVTKYSKYNWITQSSKNSMSVYQQDIVFTNCPTKDVMMKLIDDSKFDIIVIVDRLVSSAGHIINSKGKVIYAVNGRTALDIKGVDKTNFFSIMTELKNAMFTVPMFTQYPTDSNPELRVRKYLSECSEMYAMLHTVKAF